MLKIATLTRESIDSFKASWPCHGLPADLDLLVAAFAPNGDLLDYEASDSSDRRLDLSDCDGAAVLALIGDAQKVATDRPLFPGSI